MVPFREAITVLGGRDDHFKASAVLQHGLGEPGVGAVRDAGDPDELRRTVRVQGRVQHGQHSLFNFRAESAVTGDSYAHR
ncbi:hypothetical protein GCM10010211_48480 [Streptomyces albospinus]|uniref:Uncharacterized protein n=1 Tax=Streptomyces albospinus TaxID=285515 RepID=A0ABQ2VCZ0_9ACTN|nr:hypothetical protein GCM10010211_48480 [Streptomyces albospinus]